MPATGPLHILVSVFFSALVLCLFIRVILSWLPMLQGNAISRFFERVTDPIILPVQRRIPPMSAGIFDVSSTIAFFFAWWALGILGGLITFALPSGW